MSAKCSENTKGVRVTKVPGGAGLPSRAVLALAFPPPPVPPARDGTARGSFPLGWASHLKACAVLSLLGFVFLFSLNVVAALSLGQLPAKVLATRCVRLLCLLLVVLLF